VDKNAEAAELERERNSDRIFSAVCEWYGYTASQLEQEYSIDQVAKLFKYGQERERRRIATQAEDNYFAMVQALTAVANRTAAMQNDEDYDIPISCGLLDALDDNTQDTNSIKKPKIKHFTEGAPDAAAFFISSRG
jgi:hypothetical protein